MNTHEMYQWRKGEILDLTITSDHPLIEYLPREIVGKTIRFVHNNIDARLVSGGHYRQMAGNSPIMVRPIEAFATGEGISGDNLPEHITAVTPDEERSSRTISLPHWSITSAARVGHA